MVLTFELSFTTNAERGVERQRHRRRQKMIGPERYRDSSMKTVKFVDVICMIDAELSFRQLDQSIELLSSLKLLHSPAAEDQR